MIIEKQKQNEEVSPSDYEIGLLKSALPDYFDSKDQSFDLERLKELLKKKEVSTSKEAYELNFLGKNYARLESSTATTTVITPDKTHNEKPENKNSENLYIVGDNLDALKHLLGSYSGKIKCIYIDPPYNTGSDDFVYPDNFQLNAQDMAEQLGMTEEEAQRTIDMAGKSTHSAWLTFMYPRLMLARSLLTEDGVIFISIDDNEQGNLKLLCDGIFGEDNFIANILWERAYAPVNLKKHFSENHDFALCYAKELEKAVNFGLPRSEEADSRYSNPDNDPRGPWQSSDLSVGPAVESNIYEIVTPSGRVVIPPSGYSWRLSKERLQEFIEDNRIWFGENENNVPRIKRFLSEVKNTVTPMTIWKYEDVGHSQSASQSLKKLFDDKDYFTYPKPVGYIKRMLQLYADKDAMVLDFFSGSATTAHAVMDLNAEDGGNRKYIMVQLPELTKENSEAFQAGYKSIDEIGRARIEKAAVKIKEETDAEIDYGYKAYFLKELPNKTLEQLQEFSPETNHLFRGENTIDLFAFDHGGGVETMLATWMLEDGYGLGAEPEILKLENYSAYRVKNSLYLLENGLTSAGIQELITVLETGELAISRIVSYPYSFNFEITKTLRENLSNLKNTQIHLIERY